MTPEDRRAIVIYRLERSEESLRAARLLRENAMLIPAMNRIYYAMFYAVQAVLARDNASFSRHGQVKGYFNREYIKPRVFPVEAGKLDKLVKKIGMAKLKIRYTRRSGYFELRQYM